MQLINDPLTVWTTYEPGKRSVIFLMHGWLLSCTRALMLGLKAELVFKFAHQAGNGLAVVPLGRLGVYNRV